MRISVREESSLSGDAVRESSSESFNHSQDSVASGSDTAEFSDDDDVPAGKSLVTGYCFIELVSKVDMYVVSLVLVKRLTGKNVLDVTYNVSRGT